MFIIVAYDIADPNRLRQVAKVMEDYGDRVQQSIFEIEAGQTVFERMRQRTEAILNMEEDGVKYFFLCEKCIGRIESIGFNADRTLEGDFHIL